MTDTPILDDFLSALAERRVEVFGYGRKLRPVRSPLFAYEVADADADEIIKLGLDRSDKRVLDEDGLLSPNKIFDREAARLMSFGDRLSEFVTGRVTAFAYRFRNFDTVAFLLTAIRDQSQHAPCLMCCTRSVDGDRWLRQIMPFDVSCCRVGWSALPGEPSQDDFKRTFDEAAQADIWRDEVATGSSALMIINRFLTKLTEQPTEKIYRMSRGRAHRLYNTERDRKAGIMPGPVRVLDLSKPQIQVETIPVGPSMPTARTVRPYWHPEGQRTFRHPRFKNVLGQTRPVKAYGVHGAEPPDMVKTIVRGLSSE